MAKFTDQEKRMLMDAFKEILKEDFHWLLGYRLILQSTNYVIELKSFK